MFSRGGSPRTRSLLRQGILPALGAGHMIHQLLFRKLRLSIAAQTMTEKRVVTVSLSMQPQRFMALFLKRFHYSNVYGTYVRSHAGKGLLRSTRSLIRTNVLRTVSLNSRFFFSCFGFLIFFLELFGVLVVSIQLTGRQICLQDSLPADSC